MGFEKDYVYDWIIRKYQKLASNTKAMAQPKPSVSGEEFSDFRNKTCNSEDVIDDEVSDPGDESPVLEAASSDFGNKSPIQGELTPSTEAGLQNTCDIAPQLKSRYIRHEYLVSEVKDIYEGLLMLEKKCIEVDEKHAKPRSANSENPLNLRLSSHRCLDLINLHRCQLFEIYSIVVASYHPAAEPSLYDFVSEQKLPTRMFRHGIQPLSDILRDHLPDSRSNFLSFLRLSYSLAASLHEKGPRHRATWVECLYELAQILKFVEGGPIWDKRIQDWESLRDPAVTGILQADLSGVLLQEKDIELHHLFLR